jgi:hypothetical protein
LDLVFSVLPGNISVSNEFGETTVIDALAGMTEPIVFTADKQTVDYDQLQTADKRKRQIQGTTKR